MADSQSSTESRVTHTPGPWRYVDGVIVAEQFDKVYMVKREDGSEHPHHEGLTALVYGRHIDGQYTRDGNAHLIAAAPAMLDALVKLTNEAAGFLAMSDPDTHGHTNRAVLRERIRLAQDAIAKAEGRAS